MKKGLDQTKPEARTEDLLHQELIDELLIYDLKSHKAHCLNKTAWLIWKQCDGKQTVAQIACALSAHSDEPLDEEIVWFALSQMERQQLLKETVVKNFQVKSLSRRKIIRRIGIAAAVALPVVVTLLVPSAVHAASCGTSGQACSANDQCCSGMCVGAPSGACA